MNKDSQSKATDTSQKKTLSLDKNLDDIQKTIEQKEEAIKKQLLKKTAGKKVTLDLSINIKRNHPKDNQDTTSDNLNNDAKHQLYDDTLDNRYEVLNRVDSNLEAPSDSEPKAKSFMGPQVIERFTRPIPNNTPTQNTIDVDNTKNNIPAHDPKTSKYDDATEVESEGEESRLNNKKTAFKRSKTKDDSFRKWKDSYMEESDDSDVKLIVDDLDTEASTIGQEYFYADKASQKTFRRGKTKKDKNTHKKYEVTIKKTVTISDDQTLRSLASQMAEKTKVVLGFLKKLGIENITDQSTIDIETAELLVTEMGHTPVKAASKNDLISKYLQPDQPNDPKLKPKPPVVTIMGHVDHGKTSLLDYIRKTNVVDKESGGITQHIGAYQVMTKTGVKVTFIDTPGHEAFIAMRSRGSLITNIVILVVAADDSLKPQSIEAISHAKSANVPIVVAINKIDKPESNPLRVKTDLLQHNVVVEEMGGDVLCVEISAKNGTGIDTLLDSLLLQADLLDLKANYQRSALGHVIEVKQELGKGIVATVLVENGTLNKGVMFVCGETSGRVRLIHNDLGKIINSAEPGMPVEITGFNGEVFAGDDFFVVDSELDASQIIAFRKELRIAESKNKNLSSQDELVSLLQTIGENKKSLSLIIKTDVHGSAEAILGSLGKFSHDEVEIKIVHYGVGSITESDVLLSKTTGAIIYGFNVRANSQAKTLAVSKGVEVRYYAIIYDLLSDIKDTLSGLLEARAVESILGYADVRQVFHITKVGKIAGCYVTEGIVKRSAKVRLLRDNVVIYEGVLSQLKRIKDEAKEVKAGYECGIMLQGFQDITEGDVIECFEHISQSRNIDE